MRKNIGIALWEGKELALPLSSLALNLYKMMPGEADLLDYAVIAKSYSKK